MDYIILLVIAAVAFGVLYLIDKSFTKLFRGKAQHKSGLSVRLSKRYGSFGLVITVLGIAAVFTGLDGSWLLLGGGILLGLIGIGLIVYYMTFGVFYDQDSFILMTFGKKDRTYRFADIQTQQLFNSYGNIVIDLHLSDGATVQLHTNMEGVYPFMDTAFSGWLRQTGCTKENCPFYDPHNSCWFPTTEE